MHLGLESPENLLLGKVICYPKVGVQIWRVGGILSENSNCPISLGVSGLSAKTALMLCIKGMNLEPFRPRAAAIITTHINRQRLVADVGDAVVQQDVLAQKI